MYQNITKIIIIYVCINQFSVDQIELDNKITLKVFPSVPICGKAAKARLLISMNFKGKCCIATPECTNTLPTSF
jgi:hypothetical protein